MVNNNQGRGCSKELTGPNNKPKQQAQKRLNGKLDNPQLDVWPKHNEFDKPFTRIQSRP